MSQISIYQFPWKICKALVHFASTDSHREALRCVLMEVHETKLIFCATDGRRLMAMVYFEAEYVYEGDGPFIVRLPVDFIKEMTAGKLGTKLENSLLDIEQLDEDSGRCKLALSAIHKKMAWHAETGDVNFPNWRMLFNENTQLVRGSGALNADLVATISQVWKTLGNPGLPAMTAYHTSDESGVYIRFVKDDRLFALIMPVRCEEELFPVVQYPSWACGGSSEGEDFDLQAEAAAASSSTDENGEAERDELYQNAVELIMSTGRASTANLQRRLRIGYNRAARLMEQLEEGGVVGPECGTKPREILIEEGGFE
jgi:hypothetical protein